MEEKIPSKPDYIVKVILVGDSSVGKSNLMKRWSSDEFDLESRATIGLELIVKNSVVKGKVFNIQLWDTAGHERFKSLTTSYYRGCHGVFLVYDVTSHGSFVSVRTWLEEIRRVAPPETAIILIGNKMDLENLREITEEEGELYAKTNNLLFIETSALKCTNVDKAFNIVIEEIYNRSPKVEKETIESMNPGTTIKIGGEIDAVDKDPNKTITCC